MRERNFSGRVDIMEEKEVRIMPQIIIKIEMKMLIEVGIIIIKILNILNDNHLEVFSIKATIITDSTAIVSLIITVEVHQTTTAEDVEVVINLISETLDI